MIRIDDLIAKVSAYAPEDADLGQIDNAYVYSAQLHRHSFSDNGKPRLQHALEVSNILADLRLDLRCVVAGLLHDVLAEELTEPGELEAAVGAEPVRLIKELSRLSRATFQGTESARADHMRQMILASTRDLRVILILLADRLHMLRDIEQVPRNARKALARETLAIYSPIANRLGVQYFKAELEDRAFEVLEPRTFFDLQSQVDVRAAERSTVIQRINEELTTLLAEHNVRGEVLVRTKHLYSIHSKMKRTKVDLTRIYDQLASRILVQSTEECYRVLGLVHAAYTPMPGRFKDYIALPKENGYQSLHTLVFGRGGDIFEVQIRTHEMHHQAEMGIAAHFIYKDGQKADESELASVNWFRKLLENLEPGRDSRENLEMLERDLTPDQLFVFTPKGEVIKLPTNATPIDFAYAVHSEVGHRCTGAKIDGRMISIRTPLSNGGVVEIITNSRQEPKEDWLKSAISSKARGHIRSYLRKKEKQEAVEVGREQVVREARRLGYKAEDLIKQEPMRDWMQRHGINGIKDLYAAEGFGRINIHALLGRLFGEKEAKEEPLRTPPKPPTKSRKPSRSVVTIGGLDNMMTRFAKCCTPLYGDPVVGLITRGRGISVHLRSCHNLVRQVFHEDRMVEVEWVEDDLKERSVTLAISTRNSQQDLLDSIRLFEEEESQPISSGRIVLQDGEYTQHLTLVVSDSQKVQRILQRLNAIEGIRAERVLESA